jgi:exodeoxyribonuclease VII small subunit
MGDEKKELDFRAGMERLEEIIDNLESGQVDLEEALKVFEDGIKISQQLAAKLERAAEEHPDWDYRTLERLAEERRRAGAPKGAE